MSGIQVDIANLRQFVQTVDELINRFGVTGAAGVVPASLHPDPAYLNPDIGQRLSSFHDAVNLYSSYDLYRGQLVGDPSHLGSAAADPTVSSLAAFVDGLRHLSATAKAIHDNYQKAGNEDQFGADQVKALLDAGPPGTQPGTAPGTGNG